MGSFFIIEKIVTFY